MNNDRPPPTKPDSATTVAAQQRMSLLVLLFFSVDAAIMAAWALAGSGRAQVAGLYLLTGMIAAGWHFASARWQQVRLGSEVAEQFLLALVTLGVQFTAGWLEPALATAMVITVGGVIATAALRLPTAHGIGLCMLATAGTMLLLLRTPAPPGLPVANAAQQAVTAAFLAWTLLKTASVHVIGQQLRHALGQSQSQLLAALARAEALALRDELTGLPNRRAILQRLDDALQAPAQPRRRLAVAMLDLDHFKQVNDQHGHALGDAVLQALGPKVMPTLRQGDLLGRLGGEEFLLLLPGASRIEDALAIGERLRAAIAAQPWHLQGTHLPVTVSVGVALQASDDTAASLMARADAALYAAKATGRNRVCSKDADSS